MAIKIRRSTSQKKIIRFKRKKRIRGVLSGTLERPRLVVFRSNKNMYVQLVDDSRGVTLLSASTLGESKEAGLTNNISGAKLLGEKVAELAKQKQIAQVVFDRAGYLYHGKVKALAEAARASGLKF